jgi:hypothetical protein
MQEYPFHYDLSENITPFSTIRGGVSSFDVDACPQVRTRNFTRPPKRQPDSEIVWLLKSLPSGAVFSVRQTYSRQRSALSSQQPLQKGQIYETLKITSTVSNTGKLRHPEHPVAQTGQTAGICQNTRIMTINGEVRIENLKAGDMIVTRDCGLQPLLWVGKVTPPQLHKAVYFTKNSINNSRDMILCPNQLVALKGPQALLRYGQREVLIAAHTFVNGDTIHHTDTCRQVFFQLLLKNHQVIYAEAAAMESYLPSVQNLALLAPDQKQQLFKALPCLQDNPDSYGPLARYHVGETLH